MQRAIEDYTNNNGDTLWWAGWTRDQRFGPGINAGFFEDLQVNTASETVLDFISTAQQRSTKRYTSPTIQISPYQTIRMPFLPIVLLLNGS